MFNFSDMQIPPPKNWQHFELLCRDLWAQIWKLPESKMHGRNGQAQQGVDFYGWLKSGTDWVGVQCKGKDNFSKKTLTKDELNAEVKKALKFEPALKGFTLATTGPRDANIQRLARRISARHATKGLFSVDVVAWEDIIGLLEQHTVVLEKYYPQFVNPLTGLRDFQGLTTDLKDTISGGQIIHRTIKKEFAILRAELRQNQQNSQMGTTLDETMILQVLSHINENLTTPNSNTPIVEIIPPDKQQTLGLIATSICSNTASSLKRYLPNIPWDRDIRFLIRKGVLTRKKGVLFISSRIKRSLLSSEEFKKGLHQKWLHGLPQE